MLTVTLSACGLDSSGEPEPTAIRLPATDEGKPQPTEPPPPTKPAKDSGKRCGDGVCDGPEDADICPEDCATPTSQGEPERTREAVSESIPPVYVTIAGHIEDVPVYANCDAYPDYREKLLDFAETIAPYDVPINLQVENEFLQGVLQCETESLQAATDGQNVLKYLVARYGYEIDPHQEGGWEEGDDNYADVRFLAGQVTQSVSENVGGLVWNHADQFARLTQGEAGRMNPDFTWLPEILTLAVSHDHHLGDFSKDDLASGIWRPKGAGEQFWVHDPEGRLIYVGPGEHANWRDDQPWRSTPDFVRALANQLEEGSIDRDRMYTASIAVPQSVIFKPERHGALAALLDDLAPLIASGQAVYVTYSEAVSIWQEMYDAEPNIFFSDTVEPPSEKHSDESNREPEPLHVGLSVHLEGYPLGTEQTGYNEDVYRTYRERILAYSDLANGYDMPITWETSNLIGPSAAFEPNVLKELYERGDGVGIHADLGGRSSDSLDQQAFSLQIRRLRTEMEAMGIPVIHASGICSDLDWVTAARQAGIEATSGAVNYCLRSLPQDEQPPGVQACEGPGDGVCHDPYPGEFPEAMHPWRAADGATWTKPADEGLLIVPTVGTIHASPVPPNPALAHRAAADTCGDLSFLEGVTATYTIAKRDCLYGTDTPSITRITDMREGAFFEDKENYEMRALTVYQPYDGETPLYDRPVIFFVHGGGWTDNYRSQFQFVAHSFTGEMGWVTVVIDYRLTSDQVFLADEYCPDRATCQTNEISRTKAAWYPDNLHDVAAAFEWTVENAADHGGNPDQIIILPPFPDPLRRDRTTLAYQSKHSVRQLAGVPRSAGNV